MPSLSRLHLIDFEQLKIENQTVNEKIEERNEELLKLRKKNTTTVQVSDTYLHNLMVVDFAILLCDDPRDLVDGVMDPKLFRKRNT